MSAEQGERALERAQTFLNQRYAWPGKSDAEKYQNAVREARSVVRELLVALKDKP